MKHVDIWMACESGDIEYVKRYVEAGNDIEARNRAKWTPLMLASRSGHADSVRFLIDAGADVEAQDKDGQTALMRTLWDGHEDVVQILIDAGANVETLDHDGRTALMWASWGGHMDVVRTLIDAGANIEAQDKYGWTALVGTSVNGHTNVVQTLINAKADIDVRDSDGFTALMKASANDHADIVKLLLNRGANVEARDKDGWTALAHALKQGLMQIAQHLAPLTIPSPNVPYSGFSLSLFIPRKWDVSVSCYVIALNKLLPIYMERAVKDPAFESMMQRDIEEILGGKSNVDRELLTNKDSTLLTKLIKALCSIDYTERTERSKISESMDSDERMNGRQSRIPASTNTDRNQGEELSEMEL